MITILVGNNIRVNLNVNSHVTSQKGSLSLITCYKGLPSLAYHVMWSYDPLTLELLQYSSLALNNLSTADAKPSNRDHSSCVAMFRRWKQSHVSLTTQDYPEQSTNFLPLRNLEWLPKPSSTIPYQYSMRKIFFASRGFSSLWTADDSSPLSP